MSKKNSLEAKRQRKAEKAYTSGSGEYYQTVVHKETKQELSVSYLKAYNMTKGRQQTDLMATLFYARVSEKLKLLIESISYTKDYKWELKV